MMILHPFSIRKTMGPTGAAIDATSERAVSVINAWRVFLQCHFDLLMGVIVLMLFSTRLSWKYRLAYDSISRFTTRKPPIFISSLIVLEIEYLLIIWQLETWGCILRYLPMPESVLRIPSSNFKQMIKHILTNQDGLLGLLVHHDGVAYY